MMLSNSGERWLISITDMPLPRQSSSSSRMRSRTGRGSAPGPALKLATRLVACGESVDGVTRVETSLFWNLAAQPGRLRCYETFQNSRIRWGVRGTVRRRGRARRIEDHQALHVSVALAAEIRNSTLISADQREFDPFSHGIDAFGADTNAVAEMPFHRFCLGASAMADARPATAAFLT